MNNDLILFLMFIGGLILFLVIIMLPFVIWGIYNQAWAIKRELKKLHETIARGQDR